LTPVSAAKGWSEKEQTPGSDMISQWISDKFIVGPSFMSDNGEILSLKKSMSRQKRVGVEVILQHLIFA
jgi:hypothetical protein